MTRFIETLRFSIPIILDRPLGKTGCGNSLHEYQQNQRAKHVAQIVRHKILFAPPHRTIRNSVLANLNCRNSCLDPGCFTFPRSISYPASLQRALGIRVWVHRRTDYRSGRTSASAEPLFERLLSYSDSSARPKSSSSESPV